MSLNTNYVQINYLQQYFVDKITGAPLAGGKVYFWEDEARTVPKDVFRLSGSPPNYSFTSLGPSLTLSSVGTFQDNTHNDIAVYFYPYDSNGVLQLYYISVYSSDNTLQFTREGEPNILSPTSPNEQISNFIPNGQFLLHNNLPEDENYQLGQVRSDAPNIAPGGWIFRRSPGSTATDFVLFDRIGSYVTVPTGNPRYSIRINCQNPHAGDTYKALLCQFNDVNKFSSDTDIFTFSFNGKSNAGTGTIIGVNVIKYFGIGGSPLITIPLSTGGITLTSSYQTFSFNFVFGSNSAYSIGPNNDDFILLELSLPVDYVFDVEFDNFILAQGNFDFSAIKYPDTANHQYIYRSIMDQNFLLPNYDGYSVGLPITWRPYGFTFDDADIGKINAAMYDTAKFGELSCDGAAYKVSDYSPEGIPYRRLFNVLYNSGFGGCKFGTGAGFVSGYRYGGIGSTPSFLLWTNVPNAVSYPSDGSLPTGFTFFDSYPGSARYFVTSYGAYDTAVYLSNLLFGPSLNAFGAGTTSFIGTQVRAGNSKIGELWAITNINDSTYIAGSYFLISDTTTDYYVWFQKDGVGSDPGPIGARTGIMINLKSGIDALVPNQQIAKALNGSNSAVITTTAASTITPGSFFNFYNANADHYYVWYTVDGSGSDPDVSGANGIACGLLSSDSAIVVANKTVVAINSEYMAVPDLRGRFLRMTSGASSRDPDANYRGDRGDGTGGNEVGTIEDFEIQNHTHLQNSQDTPDNAGSGYVPACRIGIDEYGGYINYTGGYETRPTNINVNYFIKY